MYARLGLRVRGTGRRYRYEAERPLKPGRWYRSVCSKRIRKAKRRNSAPRASHQNRESLFFVKTPTPIITRGAWWSSPRGGRWNKSIDFTFDCTRVVPGSCMRRYNTFPKRPYTPLTRPHAPGPGPSAGRVLRPEPATDRQGAVRPCPLASLQSAQSAAGAPRRVRGARSSRAAAPWCWSLYAGETRDGLDAAAAARGCRLYCPSLSLCLDWSIHRSCHGTQRSYIIMLS